MKPTNVVDLKANTFLTLTGCSVLLETITTLYQVFFNNRYLIYNNRRSLKLYPTDTV